MTELQNLRLVPAQPGQRIARLYPHVERIEEDGSRIFTGAGNQRPNGVSVDVHLVIAWVFRLDDEELVPAPLTLSGIIEERGNTGSTTVAWLWDEMWQNPDGIPATLDECKAYVLETAIEQFDKRGESRLTPTHPTRYK